MKTTGWKAVLAATVRKNTSGPRMYDRTVYPFCWNVKMDRGITFEQVWARMCKEFYFNENEAILCIESVPALRKKWEDLSGTDLDEHVLAGMREHFIDGDTYKFCTPEREKRWGVTAPADTGWKVFYEFVGRSGGWLVMTHFEGHPLINEDVDSLSLISNFNTRCLCAMLEEIKWAVDNRFDEYEFLMAHEMRYNLQGEQEWMTYLL